MGKLVWRKEWKYVSHLHMVSHEATRIADCSLDVSS